MLRFAARMEGSLRLTLSRKGVPQMNRTMSVCFMLIAAVIFMDAGPARAQNGPNIVFILVDNVGWGDFGVYGGTIPTPRID